MIIFFKNQLFFLLFLFNKLYTDPTIDIPNHMKLTFDSWNNDIMNKTDVFMLTSSCTSEFSQLYEQHVEATFTKAKDIFEKTKGQSGPVWSLHRQVNTKKITMNQLSTIIFSCKADNSNELCL